jgi:hypothetical protein
MIERFQSLSRRRANATWDRARTLAKQGKTDEQIAEALSLSVINVQAMTREVRERQK